jgi:preprotein translocase subunit SecG
MASYLFGFLFICWMIASAFLVLVVLVQSGKGGGLSGLIGAGSSIGDSLGATGAEKTLNKWTTYSAIVFMLFTIFLGMLGPHVFSGTLVDEAKSSSSLVTEATDATDAEGDAVAPADGAEGEAPASDEAAAPSETTPEADSEAKPPVAQPDAPVAE